MMPATKAMPTMKRKVVMLRFLSVRCFDQVLLIVNPIWKQRCTTVAE
jgi:hypothetical protein